MPHARHGRGQTGTADGQRRTAFELLAYPNIAMADLVRLWPELAGLPPKIAEQIEKFKREIRGEA